MDVDGLFWVDAYWSERTGMPDSLLCETRQLMLVLPKIGGLRGPGARKGRHYISPTPLSLDRLETTLTRQFLPVLTTLLRWHLPVLSTLLRSYPMGQTRRKES